MCLRVFHEMRKVLFPSESTKHFWNKPSNRPSWWPSQVPFQSCSAKRKYLPPISLFKLQSLSEAFHVLSAKCCVNLIWTSLFACNYFITYCSCRTVQDDKSGKAKSAAILAGNGYKGILILTYFVRAANNKNDHRTAYMHCDLLSPYNQQMLLTS